jgi:hypothetical protein
MKIWLLGLSSVLLLLDTAFAQEPAGHGGAKSEAAPIRELPAPTQVTETRLAVSATFGSTVCGADSSIYYRRLLPSGVGPFEAPVTKLRADGTATTLELGEIPDLGRHVEILAFHVDSSLRIYAIAKDEATPVKEYLVEYDALGRYQSKVLLQRPLLPSALMRLPSGLFLVTGMTWQARKGEVSSSVTAIVDPSGNEVGSLKLAADDSASTLSPEGIAFNPVIERGTAMGGPDGFTYLFKAGSYPKVQVLDGTGRAVRVLQLTPPVPDSEPFEFFVDGHRLAIMFQQRLPEQDGKKRGQLILALYSAEKGELLASYLEKAPTWIACMKDGTLTTLMPTSDKKHYAIATITLP